MDNMVLHIPYGPWWALLYIAAVGASMVTMRMTFIIDFNKWAESRRQSRIAKKRYKDVNRCKHTWMLYRQGQFSLCNKCAALVATSTLLDLPPILQPLIRGTVDGQYIKPGKGNIIVQSPVNDKRISRLLRK